jgi:hypothetical protein
VAIANQALLVSQRLLSAGDHDALLVVLHVVAGQASVLPVWKLFQHLSHATWLIRLLALLQT